MKYPTRIYYTETDKAEMSDRWAGAKIPFVKIGSRAVRYLRADLEDYVTSRRIKAAGQ